jgi:L-alanine-DL-glutamate epimerase-like enolase superfamily enzyme
VKESGYHALKTNMFLFKEGGGPGTMYMPGFGGGSGSPELNITPKLISTVVTQMRTFREAVGDDVGLKLDLNYNFKTDGFIAMAKALTAEAVGGPGIDWLELDIYSPKALRQIRDAAPMPIASLESLMGRKQLLPYLEAGAVDVCIIDPLWNGVDESIKMAELCDVYEVNCAAHNYHGWLGTVICAHFCAAIREFICLAACSLTHRAALGTYDGRRLARLTISSFLRILANFKVLEVDVDDVPWKDDIVTAVPIIKDGILTLPLGPGWGIDVDEEALKLHPALSDAKTGIWSAAATGGN